MIRVVHYLPSINCTSGIANLIMNYYRLIDREKIQFDFIYFSKQTDNNFKKEIENLGGNIQYIVPPTKYKQFKKGLNEYCLTLKEKYKNDTIIFQNHQLAFTPILYKILKKNKIDNIIVHNHMTKFSDSKIKALRNLLFFLPVKFMKVKYFSCSSQACDLICKYNRVNRNNIYIMNNGIDCDRFLFNKQKREEIRKKYDLNDSFVIGHIGHFEPVKNHKFIIDLFEKIYSINNKYKLVLVGNGSLKNEILKKVESSNIHKNVIFFELRNDIPDLLSAMDCFIFPSKFEGLGIVALEAQANGLPVLISNTVPNEVIISDCNQFDINNISKWVDKILNLKIKDLSSKKKDNIVVKKSKFNINNNIKKLEEEYKRLVEKEV